MGRPAILFVENNEILSKRLKDHCVKRGFRVLEIERIDDVPRTIQNENTDLLIVKGSERSLVNGLEVARRVRESDSTVPLILVMAMSSEEKAISALRLGVNDYFKPPFNLGEIVSSVEKHLADPSFKSSAGGNPPGKNTQAESANIIGAGRSMRAIKLSLQRVASTDSTVLITGETGTGKELAAEYIHRASARCGRALVSFNCAAVPEGLIESELFGYEKGSFTGASSPYKGKLQMAHGGTVFFDEIGDMSLDAQAKILRVVENRECYRLGENRRRSLDFRIIAASNQDLEKLVSENRFRKDLFYRFNVVRIHLPPLRERKEDIPLLVEQYVKRFGGKFGCTVEGFSNEAFECLSAYEWPGNIRELKNVIESIYARSPSGEISVFDLPEPVRNPAKKDSSLTLEERELLLSALHATKWNKSKAAETLQWSRMTLYRKMAKYKIMESAKPGNETSVGEK